MVGIQNLGATCYLNSLLQMLHHLNSFRKAVYDIPVNEEDTIDSSMTLAMQGVFYHLQTGDTVRVYLLPVIAMVYPDCLGDVTDRVTSCRK